MKMGRMWYQPSVDVELTWAEVESMILLSEMHYDYRCKSLSVPGEGAILNAMRNMFEARLPLRTGSPDDLAVRKVTTITYRLTETEANLLAKVCERDPQMLHKMTQVFRALENKWKELNPQPW